MVRDEGTHAVRLLEYESCVFRAVPRGVFTCRVQPNWPAPHPLEQRAKSKVYSHGAQVGTRPSGDHQQTRETWPYDCRRTRQSEKFHNCQTSDDKLRLLLNVTLA